MTWLYWLFFAGAIAAVAAVTGVKPRGTRPVAGTHLMGVARVVLLIALAVVGYFILHARAIL